MTDDPRRQRIRDLRAFGAGAGCGLLAGIFLVSMIVWQYGNVIGSRVSADRHPAYAPNPVARWSDGAMAFDDAGPAVLERAYESQPAATTGTVTPAPAPPEVSVVAPPAGEPEALAHRDLEIPVEGVAPESLTSQFDDPRGGSRRHEAIDILAPRNTPVKAVEDGTIARLFQSKAGGLTIYQFDPSQQFCYYYAHLERYAPGLKEGGAVRKGQVIGYVGTSGNAPPDTPHLHFAIFRLTADRRWWEGTPIDPYDVLRPKEQ
jgi:murein DD-endopeptidase MepM/ murein hydrolase activator NlpD